MLALARFRGKGWEGGEKSTRAPLPVCSMRFVTIDGQVRGRAKASASGFGVLPPIQQGVVPEMKWA